MNSLPSTMEFAALVAIDWADQKHRWALQAADTQRVEGGELENTPEAVEQWAAELAQRFGGRPVAVALEQPRGAVVAMLSKYAHLVLYPVHPGTLAHYRQSFYPSGAKSDPLDTDLLLEVLRCHRDRLRPLELDTVETRTLQFLVEDRRKAVDEKTRLANRLTDMLKRYFPQILRWFDDPASPLVGDLLERWPTLQQLQKARPETLRCFFDQHNCRSQERIEERLQSIRQAIAATQDPAQLEAGTLAVAGLVRFLAQLRQTIADYDKRIAQLAQAHPDFSIFDSFPGAGPVLAPRLIAALGTNRDRFESAQQLQCYSGIAPVVQSSGQQEWIHWRWACPRFLRQTFQEFAQHSLKACQWARDYYHRQIARGKSHHAAVRALAFKWIRILFRCWKDRSPYQDPLYQQALQRRAPTNPTAPTPASPKPKSTSPKGPIPQLLELQWESCAGFSKLSGFKILTE